MRKLALALAVLLLAALLSGCGAKQITSDTLYVHKVDGLPEDFIFGMDASSVPSLESSGVVYRDFSGKEADVFAVLARAGITHIRVRVWNDPYDSAGNSYGGGNCDTALAAEIGRRAQAAGLKLIVDFHYSDFWADPSKQMAPKAWAELEPEEKAAKLYAYTAESLETILAAGGEVAMVQIGNETNGSLCGETGWTAIAELMQAGSRAVREVCPGALVAVHFTSPEKAESYRDYASKLAYYGVDYDVFGSSYYPYWHGTLENLRAVLSEIAQSYGKRVMVLETSYAYTPEDTDFSGNTVGAGDERIAGYPFTPQGQANAVRDVIAAVAAAEGGLGVCYWEGTWISVGQSSFAENEALWEQYGSGWAKQCAGSYDPEDAGKYYGGCAVDNQAFFLSDGTPLESLKVFTLVRDGSSPAVTTDSVLDAALQFGVGEEIVLPGTVEAVMTDNSRQDVPVSWEVSAEELAAMQRAGAAVYTVSGTAGGKPVSATVEIVDANLLTNGDFETGVLEPWRLINRGTADELFVEQKATDSLDGSWHMHFWSSTQNRVDFAIEQERAASLGGEYRFTVSVMGGDCVDQELRAYVLVDGQEAASAPLTISSYGNWDTAELRFSCREGQQITVGVAVKTGGKGSGAWGKIDAAALNYLG